MVFVRAQSLVLTALQLLHDTQTDLLTDLLIEVTGLCLGSMECMYIQVQYL